MDGAGCACYGEGDFAGVGRREVIILSLLAAHEFDELNFAGFGVGSTVLNAQTTITTELATGGTKDAVYPYDKSAKLIQEYVGIGLNLYIAKGHALKVEYSPIAITIDELPLSASLRMGYQISF